MITIINSRQFYVIRKDQADEGFVAAVLPVYPLTSTSTKNISYMKSSRGKRRMNNIDHVHVDGVLFNCRFVEDETIYRGVTSYSLSIPYTDGSIQVWCKVKTYVGWRKDASRCVVVEFYDNGTMYRHMTYFMRDDEEGVLRGFDTNDVTHQVTAMSHNVYPPIVDTTHNDIDFNHVYTKSQLFLDRKVLEMEEYIEGSSDTPSMCLNECCNTIFPMQASMLCTIIDVIKAVCSLGLALKDAVPGLMKLKKSFNSKQFAILEKSVANGALSLANAPHVDYSKLVNLLIKNGDKKEIAKELANGWLTYRYVILTTLMDADEYRKYLYDAIVQLFEWDNTQFFTTHASKHEGEWLFTLTCLFHPNFGLVEFKDNWVKLRGVGLQVNAAFIWDVLPFSFIVDWFLPISEAMNGIDLATTMASFDFDAVSLSRKRENVVPTDEGVLTCVSYQRHLVDLPAFSYADDSAASAQTTFNRALDGISLLIGFS